MLLVCVHPLAQKLILAVCATLILSFFAAWRIRTKGIKILIAINIVLIPLIWWMGYFPSSPLGFSNGRMPPAQGFILTRAMRSDVNVASGGTISLVGGSTTAIKLVTRPVGVHCIWRSSNGGVIDDPTNCDIAYFPPANSNFDLLKLVIQPSCHLPEFQQQLKVIVLP